MKRTLAVLVVVLLAGTVRAAVSQYMIPVQTKRGDAATFLWIPPEAGRIRGVVMAGMTLMEQHFAKDVRIREACADQQLAIVFLKSGLGGTGLQKLLDDFAEASGYGELSTAPLMFVGHSAGGPQAQRLAKKMADRCFGLLQYRGGMPSEKSPIPPGIPSLAMLGQFDEFWGTMRGEDGKESWQRARTYVASFRALGEDNLASLVVEPGAGHFAWSGRNAEYAALFIRNAAQARIPESWSASAGASTPVALKKIDPKSGWLTGLVLEDDPECASFEEYKGDKAQTSWHFDEEMAKATVAYHEGLTGRKDQFIKWKDPYWVDAGTRFFFTGLKWVGDGRTLEVHPVYADAYPKQHNNRGPKWPKAGEPAGHSEAPIKVKPVGGPMVAAGANTLRIRFDAFSPAGAGDRSTFMAYSEGDDEYRYTELVGMMPRGFRGLNSGKAQTITFPPIGNLKADSAPVDLKATSDSGLPVDYYVAYGPAVVANGKLEISELPVRAKFPIEVKVVACQFGSGIEPLVKTAAPVEQAIEIRKP